MKMFRHFAIVCLGALALTTTAGCPKGLGIPGRGSSKVDPNSCGNYAGTDAGRKVKAFLEATNDLQIKVNETVSVLKTSCVMMGTKLQMNKTELEGEANDVCARVYGRARDNLRVSIKAGAKLTVKFQPAVCKVDIDASVRASASCEGKAEAEVDVKCEGTCTGTCEGACSGSNAGGRCDGQCNGRCTGGCDGVAKASGSAECRANAEVQSHANMECKPPQLTISAEAGIIVDTTKAEMTIAALQEGLPEIFSIEGRLKPLRASIDTWANSASSLAGSARDLASSFKDQALCISGQLASAANMVTNIKLQVNVSVSITASAHGTIN
jgi:hypothetical protein